LNIFLFFGREKMNLKNNPKMGYDKELEVSSIGWRDI